MALPTQARLHELIAYDPETGSCVWLVARSRGVKAGDPVGHTGKRGFTNVSVDGHGGILLHRLIWCYMTGEWPSRIVDHEDRDRANNRWSNFRLATPVESARNRVRKKGSKTGFRGVYADGKGFQAQIKIDGASKHLGYFKTPEDAHAAYVAKAMELHGAFYPAGV